MNTGKERIKFRELAVILGIPLDNLDMPETLDRLEELVIKGRENHQSHQVVTVNTDFVVRAIWDPELRKILQEAHLATADGMPLVWGCHLVGFPLKGRVAGSDFVPALIERAADKCFSIFLLGALPQVAARAAEILTERHPCLKISGVISPPFSSILEMDPSIIDEVKAVKPDILLVAFGNPKQEKWISMHAKELQVPLMIGVGGTLDFIAGNLKRAPVWMQQIGLEWLFRLLQEPRRLWRRYVIDLVVFSFYFVRQWMSMIPVDPRKLLIPGADLVIVDNTAIINLQGSLTFKNLHVFHEVAEKALSKTPYIIIDLTKTDFLDSSAFGALVGLAREARDAGGELILSGIPPEIQHTLSLLGLDNFFISYEDINKALIAQPSKRSKEVVLPPLCERVLPIKIKGIDYGMIRTPRCLDTSTTPVFADLVIAQLEKNPYLVLDFSETIFLTSAGLAALVNFNRMASQCDGELLVANCKKDVFRVIELGKVDRILSFYTDLPFASN